jgi:hypothetical protein
MPPILSLVVFVFTLFLAGQEFDQPICLLRHGHWENSSTEGIGGRIEVSHTLFSAFVYNQFSAFVNRHFNPEHMSDTPVSDV